MSLARPASFERQMLEVADELFDEFHELPVLTVITSLNEVRRSLTEDGTPAVPREVGRHTRARLRQLRPVA